MSLGADLPDIARFILFTLFAGGLLATVLVITLRQKHFDRTQIAGLALVAGGGIGNLIDRVINGGLVGDFVSVGFGSLRTGIFNGADVAVFAGAILLTYSFVWKQRRRPKVLR